MARPKIEVFKDSAGRFRFRLKASNGRVIAAGEAYNSKEGCLKGIDAIKRNAQIAKFVDLTVAPKVEGKTKKDFKVIEISKDNLLWITGLIFGLGVLLFAFILMLAVQLGLITL